MGPGPQSAQSHMKLFLVSTLFLSTRGWGMSRNPSMVHQSHLGFSELGSQSVRQYDSELLVWKLRTRTAYRRAII